MSIQSWYETFMQSFSIGIWIAFMIHEIWFVFNQLFTKSFLYSTFFLSGLCCSWKFHHKMEQLFNKKEGATVEHGNQLGFQFYNTNLALQFAKLHFFFWDINFISSISTHDSDCSRGLQIWFYTHFCILQYLPFYYILNIIRMKGQNGHVTGF